MKQRFSAIIFLLLISTGYAQVKSISFFADYSLPLSKRLAVTKIDAVGGGVELRFKVYENYSIGFNGGYNLYSIQQDSALKQWNWEFWEIRYRGIVNDALSKNPNLSATLSPIQKMDLYPFYLTINGEFELFGNLSIKPHAGAGVLFYTRRMYLLEEWQKKFDQYNYEFSYSYRNYAEDKSGNPFSFMGGIDLGYEFTEGFILDTAVKYFYILETEGKYGYHHFPMKDVFNIKLGLTFLY